MTTTTIPRTCADWTSMARDAEAKRDAADAEGTVAGTAVAGVWHTLAMHARGMAYTAGLEEATEEELVDRGYART